MIGSLVVLAVNGVGKEAVLTPKDTSPIRLLGVSTIQWWIPAIHLTEISHQVCGCIISTVTRNTPKQHICQYLRPTHDWSRGKQCLWILVLQVTVQNGSLPYSTIYMCCCAVICTEDLPCTHSCGCLHILLTVTWVRNAIISAMWQCWLHPKTAAKERNVSRVENTTYRLLIYRQL